jgi:2',3'-cyclic-nucleotide 2'-phosphodiesterase (5'-nucleotidase family)
MIKKTSPILLIVSLLAVTSCTRYFVGKPVQLRTVSVSDTTSAPQTALSQGVKSYLQPYSDSLGAKMNAVLAQSPRRLSKGQPESELGNLMADLLREMGSERLGKPVDVAVTNSGGIRTDLPAGSITLGDVYQVMPFDNELVALTLTGDVMKKVVEYIAQRREPQSGLKLTISKASNQLTEALVNGQPLDPKKSYVLLTSDYMATSSDMAKIVANPQNYQVLGYLMRDAMADYLRRKGQQNQIIDPKRDGRTRIVE